MEIWVLLLEKSYAKCFLNYENIEAGYLDESLRDLSGMSCLTVPIEEIEFEKVMTADQKNYIMCASCSGEEEGNEELKQFGLISGHAYALLSAARVPDPDGNEVEILKLRNPWGNFEWNGAWSDTSDLWTEESCKIVGRKLGESIDDGSFWISFQDFAQFYSSATCCFYHPYHNYNSVEMKQVKGGYSLVEIETKKVFSGHITVCQLDRRFKGKLAVAGDYDYSKAMIALFRPTTDEDGQITADFIDCKYGKVRDLALQVNELPPGKYVIASKVGWKTGAVYDTTISVQSSSERVQLRQLRMQAGEKKPTYTFKQLMIKELQEKGNEEDIVNGNENVKYKTLDFLDKMGAYFASITNNDDKKVKVKVEYAQMVGFYKTQAPKWTSETTFVTEIEAGGYDFIGLIMDDEEIGMAVSSVDAE